MRGKWTREEIIRQILQREAAGQPLALGENGVGQSLYQAASRVFGCWRNAVFAAGIPPERAKASEPWQPNKILMVIRNLSRCRRPMSVVQVERRYGSLVSAARRVFGSWSKAVVAAGVDPAKFQRVMPWTRDRIIEAILTRALNSAPLAPCSTEPRSLVEAAQRIFGSWAEALKSAGLDPAECGLRRRRAYVPDRQGVPFRKPVRRWTAEKVLRSISARSEQNKPMNPNAVSIDNDSLYRAARRQFGSWSDALRAAGIDPPQGRRFGPPRKIHETKGAVGDKSSAGLPEGELGSVPPEN